MTPFNPKELYSHFLKAHQGKLHFAAHSHHFWPDISRVAQLEYWDDCAKLSDEKWGKIFGEVIPKTQNHIATILGLKHSEQIALAPNTHELLARILSLFLGKKELTILTTKSEFHSWSRQVNRLSEMSEVKITALATEKILKDRAGFIQDLKKELTKKPDLFFISHVFFDSGLALTDEELFELTIAADKSTLIVIDGYHAFCAIPTNLSKLEGRVFYLGGGYKYAQAGEGVGFLVAPKANWRPAYTGWFAEYADLAKPKDHLISYAPDAMAFMGATQDPSGFYRFNAVWDQFGSKKMGIKEIHEYVLKLQKIFIKNISAEFIKKYQLTPLFTESLNWHGHFLTFKAPDLLLAQEAEILLKKNHILIDRRGERLRFGFGLYQNEQDIHQMTDIIKNLS